MAEDSNNQARFPLGQLFATSNAVSQVPNPEMIQALSRHHKGDWGDVGRDDWRANNDALNDGTRLLSAYKTNAGVKFWIITEADRSSTTVLLPEDY